MKKSILFILIAIMMFSVLPAAAEDVEITWWAFPTFAKVDETAGLYEQQLADEFMARNPGIKVTVEMIDFASGPEKIATAIQGGTAPDVLFDAPGRIVDYGKNGALANLNDLFTDEFKADVNNEKLIGSCSDGTDYWMYPISSAPFVMAVNKTYVEEAGLWDMVPTEGERTWTTDEFTALNKALAEKGYSNAIVFCSGQGGDQGTRAFMSNLYSTWITNDDLSAYIMNEEPGVKAMQYVIDEVANGDLTNGSAYNGGEAIEQFAAGNVTETLLWGPVQAKQNTQKMTDLGYEPWAVSMPSDDGVPALEYLVNGFAVFNNGDEAKIAAGKKFIQFLCDDPEYGPKNVVQTGSFPVRESYGNLYPDDAEMAFYASLTKYYGGYYNTIDGYASMRPAWFSNLQAALAGDKDAQTAMDDYVKDSNQSIADAQ